MWFEVCRLDAARCCRDVLQTVKVCRKMPPRATSCHHESINKPNSYGRLWEPVRRTWNSQTMSEIHSHSFPSRECQSQTTSHNTQTIPDADEFIAVRSHATLCVALCKPRRPSVQLLQRESIRARWLEMARVISAACGFIVLHYHIDLSPKSKRSSSRRIDWMKWGTAGIPPRCRWLETYMLVLSRTQLTWLANCSHATVHYAQSAQRLDFESSP